MAKLSPMQSEAIDDICICDKPPQKNSDLLELIRERLKELGPGPKIVLIEIDE